VTIGPASMRAEPFDELTTTPVEARPSTGSGHMVGVDDES
jgi:hypothetical protein